MYVRDFYVLAALNAVSGIFLRTILLSVSRVFCFFLCLNIRLFHTLSGNGGFVKRSDCAFYGILRLYISQNLISVSLLFRCRLVKSKKQTAYSEDTKFTHQFMFVIISLPASVCAEKVLEFYRL